MTDALRPAVLPLDPTGKRSLGWWGMTFLVVNEAVFFAYLLFSWFYLGAISRSQWPPSGPPSLKLVIPNTLILLASSGTMLWADHGIRRGDRGRLRIGLFVTFLLGVVFLLIQGVEYSKKYELPQTSAASSLFYTITGFHGLHVLVGILMLVFLQVRAWLGHFTAARHEAVSNVGLYWHFVDAVWLTILTSLYLVPHLG